jgi:hypothetical protein
MAARPSCRSSSRQQGPARPPARRPSPPAQRRCTQTRARRLLLQTRWPHLTARPAAAATAALPARAAARPARSRRTGTRGPPRCALGWAAQICMLRRGCAACTGPRMLRASSQRRSSVLRTVPLSRHRAWPWKWVWLSCGLLKAKWLCVPDQAPAQRGAPKGMKRRALPPPAGAAAWQSKRPRCGAVGLTPHGCLCSPSARRPLFLSES